jgi:hypothetical protein
MSSMRMVAGSDYTTAAPFFKSEQVPIAARELHGPPWAMTNHPIDPERNY